MTAHDFIEQLTARDVRLVRRGAKLRVRSSGRYVCPLCYLAVLVTGDTFDEDSPHRAAYALGLDEGDMPALITALDATCRGRQPASRAATFRHALEALVTS